ncbi:D-hexose-6-phosphate mutarotase [Ornithinimicrobium cerasi]|uniref:Putative glucose-6-phosphate 1-epimerase n=1 Tax=Ornithinimicrobium cerasi TaxID=2248773 RepID=A0A285VK84_9MICO|nr:D-hexose-6-phosphate mutarotase [Ornithinimicrobium cerasi]SOC54393.1 glucose-6-phosphate 1-epimerase [Ornithinimicrobium cerasi]
MTTLTPRVHDADGSRLVAYDLGATLAEWDLDGEPVLWLSDRAVLDGSAPLRGGIPICFPWFAAGPEGDRSPSHGLVRTATWRSAEPADEEVWAWEVGSADVSGAERLTGPFELRYAVGLRPGREAMGRELLVALAVTNPADAPLTVEAALHTYLAVEDVRATRVLGLDGVEYYDKVDGVRRVQRGPLTFTGETDRVYDSGAEAGIVVDDGSRQLHLRPAGATQAVVWNPWAERCAEVADLADDAWQRFVCVETAATAHRSLTVPPGGTSTLSCTFAARPRSTT